MKQAHSDVSIHNVQMQVELNIRDVCVLKYEPKSTNFWSYLHPNAPLLITLHTRQPVYRPMKDSVKIN